MCDRWNFRDVSLRLPDICRLRLWCDVDFWDYWNVRLSLPDVLRLCFYWFIIKACQREFGFLDVKRIDLRLRCWVCRHIGCLGLVVLKRELGFVVCVRLAGFC